MCFGVWGFHDLWWFNLLHGQPYTVFTSTEGIIGCAQYLYINQKYKPNSVRPFLSWQCFWIFVFLFEDLIHTPLVHYIVYSLSIVTNHLTTRANSLLRTLLSLYTKSTISFLDAAMQFAELFLILYLFRVKYYFCICILTSLSRQTKWHLIQLAIFLCMSWVLCLTDRNKL